MTYTVKEAFYTLQGEGANAGRPAVFCRFSGCNLWSGREADRARAMCRFCDTDFVGTDGPRGGRFPGAAELAAHIDSLWPAVRQVGKLVVFTGGEPLLQLDPPLVVAVRELGFTLAVETNGTLPVPDGVHWVCVSPKARAKLVVTRGSELKVVHPQEGQDPERYLGLDFQHFFLQPLDGDRLGENTRLCVEYCLRDPRWRLSLQTHKLIGIP